MVLKKVECEQPLPETARSLIGLGELIGERRGGLCVSLNAVGIRPTFLEENNV